jgi:hypothetical protein
MSTMGLIGEKGGATSNDSPSLARPNFGGPPTVGAGNPTTSVQPSGQLIDQRLDPNQIYLRYDPDTGSSRMSVRSLRDDTDYSRRVLRVSLPDIPKYIAHPLIDNPSSSQIRMTSHAQSLKRKKNCIRVINLGIFLLVLSVDFGGQNGYIGGGWKIPSTSLYSLGFQLGTYFFPPLLLHIMQAAFFALFSRRTVHNNGACSAKYLHFAIALGWLVKRMNGWTFFCTSPMSLAYTLGVLSPYIYPSHAAPLDIACLPSLTQR